MTKEILDLTIIVPCYNEGTIIKKHYEAVVQSLSNIRLAYQIAYLDDGSTDSTREVILSLPTEIDPLHPSSVNQQPSANQQPPVNQQSSSHHQPAPLPRVQYISNPHLGKEVAVREALTSLHNQSKYTIVMDVDFEDPPELIPTLYQQITANTHLDQVVTIRNGRPNQNLIRKWGAYLYYTLTGEPQGLRDYRIMTQSALHGYASRPKCDILKIDMSAKVLPTEYIHYNPTNRIEGESKWSLFGLMKLAIKSILHRRWG